ncbi:MAG: FAD-dependent oxidoreductase, partial [Erysipelotrichaceae bacterium]|nr:FAD-dependent oxidoreductase [Erysipelotrichaceae bacterium]
IVSICSASVKSISKKDDILAVNYLDRNGDPQTAMARQVLIATGRKANLEGLLGDECQPEVFRGIVSDAEGRTNIPGIYVIGDARSGNIQLAHVAEAQGENIVDLILGKEPVNDMKVIPSGVYTDPEIATVGSMEKDLKTSDIAYETHKFLTGANGKCLIENSESGFVKVLTVENVIVGGQIIAPHATELIGELAIAVQKKMTMKEFAEVVHPHPTVSEMLWDAVKE